MVVEGKQQILLVVAVVAGGFRTATGFPLAAATISGTTVGAGGVERSDGADSNFSTITATGGGRGADNSTDAGAGGSGGGGNGGGGALKQPYGPGGTGHQQVHRKVTMVVKVAGRLILVRPEVVEQVPLVLTQ